MIKKKHFTKFKIKDKVLRNELARAHSMIILLTVALMAVLALSSQFGIVLEPVLTFIIVVMLAIVGLLSLSVITAIMTKRR